MTVETLAQGTKTLRRRRALEPYLVKIQEALSLQSRDGTQHPRVSIDGVALSLDPWLATCLDPRGAGPDDASDRTELLRESLALWLKSSIDVRNLRRCVRGGSKNLYALQAETMLDSAFGSALLRELQDTVDGLVKRGALDEAKRVSRFQHQVRCVVRELKQSIDESNGKRDHDPGGPPTDHALAAAPHVESVGLETEPSSPMPRRRPRPPAPKPVPTVRDTSRSRYRTEVLVALDVIALVACILLAVRPRMLDRTPRALTPADFPIAAPLVEVVARPPALYASVDEKTWSDYDDKQKRRFVDGIGNVLLTNGYWGLLLKTSDGRVVAGWLENGGTRLFTAEPKGLAASAPAAQYTRFVP